MYKRKYMKKFNTLKSKLNDLGKQIETIHKKSETNKVTNCFTYTYTTNNVYYIYHPDGYFSTKLKIKTLANQLFN